MLKPLQSRFGEVSANEYYSLLIGLISDKEELRLSHTLMDSWRMKDGSKLPGKMFTISPCSIKAWLVHWETDQIKWLQTSCSPKACWVSTSKTFTSFEPPPQLSSKWLLFSAEPAPQIKASWSTGTPFKCPYFNPESGVY